MALKRHTALQQLSREHHHALMLCWKIRTGFSKGVSVQRIKSYADWFYTGHLLPHFELEEKYIFPILGNDSLIAQALNEHRSLSDFFKESNSMENALKRAEVELAKHIHFEERVLFNKIQNVASPEQLHMIKLLHTEEKFVENTDDVFWK